ncbi:Gp19/Gp15/Gp42 family protein [Glutamicibacter sp. AOP5-A2-18]|uniref:Gp19/Gp15/Gp42 family protein n=1 Tax=Glutamicibacter sp. AOP5-A2-18 TaxID=3457656 RepID=UPI004033C7BC
MSFATVEDVQKRLGRDLTTAETAQATEWLQDLEADIRARIPDIDVLMADEITGLSYTRTVTRVVAETIVAKLKNPKGLRQYTESVDDYSLTETVDTANSSGRLVITDADWDLLIPSLDGDAFSIRLVGRFR